MPSVKRREARSEFSNLPEPSARESGRRVLTKLFQEGAKTSIVDPVPQFHSPRVRCAERLRCPDKISRWFCQPTATQDKTMIVAVLS